MAAMTPKQSNPLVSVEIGGSKTEFNSALALASAGQPEGNLSISYGDLGPYAAKKLNAIKVALAIENQRTISEVGLQVLAPEERVALLEKLDIQVDAGQLTDEEAIDILCRVWWVSSRRPLSLD